MGVIAPKYKALLAEWNVPYEEGQHTAGRILDADRVVKSPGIPDKAPMMKAVRERGIPVESEIEFAAPYTSARTICVTGSNGKTTTTTLTYEILRRAGANVALGGNIGRSFALSVATERRDWYVIELSSFQLDGCYDFRADIGVLTNITPDHLDRYEYRLQNYVDSKFRILRNQRPQDCFIYCADDPLTLENLPKHPLSMRTLPFSVRRGDCAAVLRDGTIRAEAAGRRLEIPVSELRIKGMHNTYDAMAAVLAALSAGIEPDAILPTLRSFEGVEHRAGALRRDRRRRVRERLEGDERRFGMVRSGEHDAAGRVDRRRNRQGQRLFETVRSGRSESQGARLHGASTTRS